MKVRDDSNVMKLSLTFRIRTAILPRANSMCIEGLMASERA